MQRRNPRNRINEYGGRRRSVSIRGSSKGVSARGQRTLRALASACCRRAPRLVLWIAVGAVERSSGSIVRFTGPQVLHFRTHAVPARFLFADMAVGHRGIVLVFLHGACRTAMVRIRLSADR